MSQEALAGTEAPARIPLGQLLIQAGFLTQVQLDDALYEGSRTGERLGEVVVRRGLATEDDVAQLLAEQWGLDYVDRASIWFDANALARLSREDAQRLEALPTRVEGGRVVVAVAEPTEQRLEALRELIGGETVMIVVPKSALDAGLRSDLLRSAARGQFSAPDDLDDEQDAPDLEPAAEGDADADAGSDEDAEHDDELDPEDEPELKPVALAAVKPLTDDWPEDEMDHDSDAVALLADEAQAVAERLAAQAAAVRAQQIDLRNKSEQYEQRIEELEQHLDERTEQLNRVRSQLTDLLASFDD
ncbi:MAG: GspE/PulE/PilB domain-containing protein [Gaiellaceae bacterium]